LTSGPFGPWIVFALKTAPNAALLAFTFVFVLAVLFCLLILCAGDPKRMLPTVLLIAPIAGTYVGILVGGITALFGWPIIWLFERIFALSPEVEVRASSFIKFNYLSLGLIIATALVVVIVLLIHGISTEQREAQRQFAKQRLPSGRELAEPEYLEGAEVAAPSLHKPDNSTRVGGGYRRIGLLVGSIFALFPIVLGLIFARRELSISLLMYCGAAAVILFLIPYVISRSLGWIVDNFFSKMQTETSWGVR
jgi:hypothetical protein